MQVIYFVIQQTAGGFHRHHFAHSMHEQEGSQHHARFDGDGQIERNRQHKSNQQNQPIAPMAAQQMLELLDLAHVPGHDQ